MRTPIRLWLVTSVLTLGCGGGGENVKRTPAAMPQGGTFTGVYFSPQYGEMNLIQTGSAVVGEYKQEQRSGKIQGEAEGDLLRFEWTEHKAMVINRPQETRGRGYFRYMIDASNGDHLLKGEWGLGGEESGGGPWNGYKAKNRAPSLSRDASSGGESGGASSSTEGDDDLF